VRFWVQIGPGRPEIGGGGWWQTGSLLPEPSQSMRRKPLQDNALYRRVSVGFIADNRVVGWVRYGLESVREADANADCGVMGGGRERRRVRRVAACLNVSEIPGERERLVRRAGDRTTHWGVRGAPSGRIRC